MIFLVIEASSFQLAYSKYINADYAILLTLPMIILIGMEV